MNKKYLVGLFQYNFRMNEEIISILEDNKNNSKKIINIFSHLLKAEKIWLMRLKGEDLSGQMIWPDLTIKESQDLIIENIQMYKQYFMSLKADEITKNLNYRNSKGQEFQIAIVDILIHVVIHSSYHRGQIAMLVREQGGNPINTDYINYIRNLKST